MTKSAQIAARLLEDDEDPKDYIMRLELPVEWVITRTVNGKKQWLGWYLAWITRNPAENARTFPTRKAAADYMAWYRLERQPWPQIGSQVRVEQRFVQK